MKTSQAGIDLIKRYESLRLESYRDTGGVWTIGYGHTKGVTEGMVITEQEAEDFLREDLQEAERAVGQYITIILHQHEFDALVSFTLNVGVGALRRSTLRERLNDKKRLDVPEQLCRWKNDNGVPLKGLLRRRLAEATMFVG